MKLSEVTVIDVCEFCRADINEESTTMEAILAAGKQFVLSQTGMTEEQADTKEDLTLAMLMFCSDMYDRRCYTVDKAVAENPAAKAIINQYCMNIL